MSDLSSSKYVSVQGSLVIFLPDILLSEKQQSKAF